MGTGRVELRFSEALEVDQQEEDSGEMFSTSLDQ